MTKKVLIVEDEPGVLDLMRTVLSAEKFEVMICDDGRQAHEMAVEQKPDLILLDIWMAGKDGPEIVKDLKTTPDTKHIPVVMVSANNQTRQIAQQSGANDFLEKPFNISDLIAITQKYLVN